jgi:hypothetical protein
MPEKNRPEKNRPEKNRPEKNRGADLGSLILLEGWGSETGKGSPVRNSQVPVSVVCSIASVASL